jgi:hypothetical protein
MTAPEKVKAAKRQAGAMALRLMQDATKDLYEAREFMRAHSTTRNRSIGHHCAKLAIENLRAARLIYDKLPRYAK